MSNDTTPEQELQRIWQQHCSKGRGLGCTCTYCRRYSNILSDKFSVRDRETQRECERLGNMLNREVVRAEQAERERDEAVRLLNVARDGMDECWIEDCNDGRKFVRDRDALIAALAKGAK